MTSPLDYELMAKMAGDFGSAQRGCSAAWRDINLIETFYAMHDLAHQTAIDTKSEFDCTQMGHDFWGRLGGDVKERADSVEEMNYKFIVNRHLIERNAEEFGQKFTFVTMESGPEDGESFASYIARIEQAIQDEENLKRLDPDNVVSETQPDTNLFGMVIADLEMPDHIDITGPEDEEEGDETNV